MDGGLAAAPARLDRAFARYPLRPVLEGCPHCRRPTRVDEDDLSALSIRLGNTVGDLHAAWLERPQTGDRLYAALDRDYDSPWFDDLAWALDLLHRPGEG